ncbi:MAG: hypothetical protein QOC84_3158 [Bradyrhizobium sp.]|jgi:hypothetical protein|nr:hypothetical protein [Bradyrhizobium sp.]
MSSLSEQDHLNPNDPAYYAPRWLRERSEPRSSSLHEAISDTGRAPGSPPGSLDTQLENAVSGALWHPLDPEVIHEPDELARELDRRAALMTVAARCAAAIGVAAVVALFFVIMVPASRQSDTGSSTSGANTQSASVPSTKAAPQSGQREDGSKSALAEFQTLLASAQASQPATHEQSEQLLQKFLQWGQKPGPANAPR